MKPITRKEIFENAIAHGEKAPIKPMTRKEIIMAKEAKRESKSTGGDCDWNTMKNKPFGETTVTGDTLTWDGNTEGLEMTDVGSDGYLTFYKVSDATPTIDNLSDFALFISGTEEDCTVTDLSNGLLSIANAESTMLALVVPNDSFSMNGVTIEKKGVYFLKSDTIHTSQLTINNYNGFETTETVPLPNKYLSILETVGGDTLTWDGDTSGLESIDIMGDGSLFYRVTEVYPTLEEAQGGGVAHDTTGFGAEVSCADMTENFGVGGYFLTAASGAIPAFCISQNTTVEGLGDLYKGVYLQGGISSLTINGYTGFTKEQVKQEYLPKSAIEDIITAVLTEKGLLS